MVVSRSDRVKLRAGARAACCSRASPCNMSRPKMRHVENQAACARCPCGMKQDENPCLKRHIAVLHPPCALSISRAFTPITNSIYSPGFSSPGRHSSSVTYHVCLMRLQVCKNCSKTEPIHGPPGIPAPSASRAPHSRTGQCDAQ